MQHIIAIITTGVVFGLLDSTWFRFSLKALYLPEIGTLIGPLRWGPALAFYVLYVIGIQIFAVRPALAAASVNYALVHGALFGFFCYMTWNLTNYAVMKTWSLKVTLVDMTWGTTATAITAAAATYVALRFAPVT